MSLCPSNIPTDWGTCEKTGRAVKTERKVNRRRGVVFFDFISSNYFIKRKKSVGKTNIDLDFTNR
jgi:hypothetical protein